MRIVLLCALRGICYLAILVTTVIGSWYYFSREFILDDIAKETFCTIQSTLERA